MIVNMAMIFDALSKEFDCKKGISYKAETPVERVRIVRNTRPEQKQKGDCFILNSESGFTLAGVPSEASILIANEESKQGALCAILIKSDFSLEYVRNKTAEAIGFYETWANDLFNLSIHGAGLPELVDCAYGLFKNPLTIIDHNFRILSQTEYDCMEDELWVRGSQDDTRVESAVDSEDSSFVAYLNKVRETGYIRNRLTSTGYYLDGYAVKNTPDSLVVVNVVQKNHRTSEGEFCCLEYFSKIVSAEIKMTESFWKDDSNSYMTLLHDLVRGNLSNYEEFKANLSASWIKVKPLFTVMSIAAQKGILKHHQLCKIEDEMNALVPQGRGVIHERALVVFINHDDYLDKALFDAVSAYAIKKNLSVGVSETRGDYYSLYDLFQQSKYALRMAKKLQLENNVLHYEDFRPYYIFEICSKQQDWQCYIHPCIEQLSKHDESNSLELLPTLASLMRNHGNKTQVAHELEIQRNTLQYRLEKIEQCCNIDLSDDETFDHIAFSFELLAYIGSAES